MVFSSIPFLYYFLPAVLAVYFLTPRKGKNAVLLLASLIFYGWGELRMLPLMGFTILLCYVCGLGIERSRNRKKLWLLASIVISVGLLGVFKYADFFIGSLNAVTGLKIPLLHLALPVGISFYTFQCLSYTIDVYRGSVPAQKNLINFGAYVALFPQLIAGPIVRYADIARELEHREHSWENAAVGLRRFLVGLGKKVILADNFALLIRLFRQSGEKSVLFYWMYAVAFTLNIYFDFSGYSDIAVGAAALLGVRLSRNFDHPYRADSLRDFWRRWHISLTRWFTDYVYIPLGGSRRGTVRLAVNTMVVFLLSGLWHGAALHFVVWGGVHGVLLLLEKAVTPCGGKHKVRTWTAVCLRHAYTFSLVCIAWVFFRAASVSDALLLLSRLPVDWSLSTLHTTLLSIGIQPVAELVLGALCLHLLPETSSAAPSPRSVLAFCLLALTVVAAWFSTLHTGTTNAFIYFQF